MEKCFHFNLWGLRQVSQTCSITGGSKQPWIIGVHGTVNHIAVKSVTWFISRGGGGWGGGPGQVQAADCGCALFKNKRQKHERLSQYRQHGKIWLKRWKENSHSYPVSTEFRTVRTFSGTSRMEKTTSGSLDFYSTATVLLTIRATFSTMEDS